MINDIKECIVETLLEIYPNITIYDEDIPQNFKTPSFLITLTDHQYAKRINNKFDSEISFDISFFSSKENYEIKADCLNTQQELFRCFDFISRYRALDKEATIVDNVLHFKFNVKYSEIKEMDEVKIQNKDINTNIKE